MRAAGYAVECHDDHFPDTRTKDEVWLTQVASRGWIAFSHNKAIRRVKEERDAAMRAGLALFFLIGKHHEDYQRNLVATMPRVITFRERHEPPFIAKIHRPDARFPIGSHPGRVEMDLTKEEWLATLDEESRA
ncbi:MAG: hypothetical protein M3Q09_11165 [Gemmatimonadota bacterium]|nr:hypothetical protein [Gemmatimonadota bacterium]